MDSSSPAAGTRGYATWPARSTGVCRSPAPPTVARRLRAVEERIGRSVATRRAELETALRLRDYLAPAN
jgi:hypothetical protein